MAVFLDLAPCGQVVIYRRFGLTYCLHCSEKRKPHRVDTCVYNPTKRETIRMCWVYRNSLSV